MVQALWRNEFTAQLRARKCFLLGEQYSTAAHCQVDRGAAARRTSAGDYCVIALRLKSHFSLQPAPVALAASTRRYGKCRSTVTFISPACWPRRSNSQGLKLRRIESAPSSRTNRLCRNNSPTVV